MTSVMPWVTRLVMAVSVLLAALFLSWLLAIWLPGITLVLHRARAGLGSARVAASEAARRAWEAFSSYWAARKPHFERPYVRALVELNETLSNIGASQVKRLELCASEFRRSVASLEPQDSAGGTVTPRNLGTPVSLFGLVVIGAFLALFSFTNFWLLRIFFIEHLSAEPFRIGNALVTPGDVMAVLFPLAEIAAGFMLFLFHKPTEELTVARTFYVGAWVTLIGLCFIEAIAYGILSRNANLAGSLGIDERNILYLPVLYSFAIFGIAITLGLAGLTHAICTQLTAYRGWRLERREEAARNQSRKDMQHHSDRVQELKRSLETARDEGEKLVAELRRQLRLGADNNVTSVLSAAEVEKAVGMVLRGEMVGPEQNPGLAGQAILYTLMLFGWLAASAVQFLLLVPLLGKAEVPDELAAAGAILMIVVITVGGHALTYGRSWRRGHMSSASAMSVADMGMLVVILVGCAVGAAAGISAKDDSLVALVWGGIGVLSVLGIVACAGRLVEAFSVIPVIAAGVLAVLVLAVALLGAAVALVLIALVHTLEFVLSILAVPGQALRRQGIVRSEAA